MDMEWNAKRRWLSMRMSHWNGTGMEVRVSGRLLDPWTLLNYEWTWNGSGMEWNGMEWIWNGIEWNRYARIEWNRME